MIDVAIFDDNLKPFLVALGWVVGYTVDADDIEAVSTGLRDTDSEEDRWYDYEFHGRHRTDFSLAFDETGSGLVSFRIEIPAELATQVRLFADFCCDFHWR